jgi:hypothetical protein
MQKQKKKEWTSPQLVVVGRGMPEEAVLVACKTALLPAVGPNGHICSPLSHPVCQDAFAS